MVKLLWVDSGDRRTGSIEVRYHDLPVEMHRVTSNSQAWEFLRSGNYDFIFYDLDMDTKDYGFAKMLKEMYVRPRLFAVGEGHLPSFFEESIEPTTLAHPTNSLMDLLEHYRNKGNLSLKD